MHKEDNFWRTTFEDPGIFCPYLTTTQVQVLWNDVTVIEAVNNCTSNHNDQCFELHVQKSLLKEVGCQPPGLGLQDLEECQDEDEIIAAEKIVIDAANNLDEVCKKPCHFLDMIIGSRNFDYENSLTRFYGYFTHKVPVSTEKFLMDRLYLIAEVGGMAGLLLGVSFFHVVKLITYFLDMKIEANTNLKHDS